MQCRIDMSPFTPEQVKTFIAALISSISAIPVESIIGLFWVATNLR